MSRLSIVVGHDPVSRGALAVSPLGIHEYDYNLEISSLMMNHAALLGVDAKVFLRTEGLEEAYRQANEWAFDAGYHGCSIELHFNAADSPAVKGTETLYYRRDSEELAKIVQVGVLEALGFGYQDNPRDQCHNRRTKLLSPTDRGHRNLCFSKGPAVIVEPFFGSNADDAALGLVRKDEYAYGLVLAARSFLATRSTR